MPELPEVETVTKSIKRHLIGESFSSMTVHWKKTLHNFTPNDFNNKVKSRKVKDVYRRAKYIVIDLDEVIMPVHLRMTGKLYVSNLVDTTKKHISLYLQFNDKYLQINGAFMRDLSVLDFYFNCYDKKNKTNII